MAFSSVRENVTLAGNVLRNVIIYKIFYLIMFYFIFYFVLFYYYNWCYCYFWDVMFGSLMEMNQLIFILNLLNIFNVNVTDGIVTWSDVIDQL